MSRFVQPLASRGSQKWIQTLINEKPDVLNKKLQTKLGLSKDDEIEWLSPLKEDEYAEYLDELSWKDLALNLIYIR